MVKLNLLSAMGKQFVLTKPRWVVILDSDIEPYKYGYRGAIILKTERWQYPIHISSIHLQDSETLKNLKVKFEIKKAFRRYSQRL